MSFRITLKSLRVALLCVFSLCLVSAFLWNSLSSSANKNLITNINQNTPILENNSLTFGAPDFIVNTLDNVKDGSCTVAHCSLRDAIVEANADGVASTISFSVAGTINLDTIDNSTNGLPAITTPITINGGGNITVNRSSGGNYRIFYVSGTGDLTLDNITITNGRAVGAFPAERGGAIFNDGGTVTLQNGATIRGNSSSNVGGGITNAGTLTLNSATIAGNTTDSGGSGGGIFSYGTLVNIHDSVIGGPNLADRNVANFGGGIDLTAGTLNIINSTINNNQARQSGAGIDAGGGATVNMLNTTVSGNHANNLPAPGGGSGGGLVANGGSTVVNITNSTFANNVSSQGGDQIYSVNGAAPILKNSIFQGGDGCQGSYSASSVNNTGPNCPANNGVNSVTGLGALANNGGATQTHALTSGSVEAYNKATDCSYVSNPANNSFFNGILGISGSNHQVTIDQRGTARPQFGMCDVGAYESTTLITAPPALMKTFSPGSVAVGGTSVMTFTFTNSNPTDMTGVTVTDNFPAGMVAGNPALIQTTNCGGSIVTDGAGLSFEPGDTSIRVSNATVVNGTPCVVTANVIATTEGNKVNTTDAVSSTNAGTGPAATATLGSVAAPSFTKNFGAMSIPVNTSTTLSFNIINNSATSSLTNVSFNDTFPAGLRVAIPPNITGSCGGGTITANAWSGFVQLSNAALPAGASCSFTVNVTAITSGMKNNSVNLTTNETATGPTAMASLNVLACSPSIEVTNSNDSGAGSLRQAVIDACDGGTIAFNGIVTSDIILTSGEIVIGKNLTINGQGAGVFAVSGNNSSRVFSILSGFTVNINSLTISNGLSATGGGVRNDGILSMSGVRVVNNTGTNNSAGGGIYNTASLTITNSTIANNTGVGLNFFGAGIENIGGSVVMRNSTVSGNINPGAFGGGVHNHAGGTFTAVNSTFSGNSANQDGGGIHNGSGTTTLLNCTVAFNNAVANGGGVSRGSDTVNLFNTLVGKNTAPTGPDVWSSDATPINADYSLIEDSTGATINGSNNVNGDPQISVLVNSDTGMQIHRLRRGSPALDKGAAATDPITSNPITTDQRGVTRPIDISTITNATGGNGSDIGAVESNGLPDVPLDFDGDGKSDYVVVEFPTMTFEGKLSDADTKDGEAVRGSDILANSKQRAWQKSYNKLLHFRAGRGFIDLPKDVQDSLAKWKREGNPYGTLTTEGSGLTWLIRKSSDGTLLTYHLGETTDEFVPADYDGDGKCDAAVWNPTEGFRVVNSATSQLVNYPLGIGNSNADPTVVGDYDNDGLADPAIYDPTTGLWSWLGNTSHNIPHSETWMPNGIPAPGDYDGDGDYDFGVQLPPLSNTSAAKFRIAFNDGSVGPASDITLSYGLAVFSIVPGDYDGDGKCDIAQVNLSGASIIWRVALSSTGFTTQVKTTFGVVASDRPVQGDYDGDGKIDRAIFRASISPDYGAFYVIRSSDNTVMIDNWGSASDYPVAFFNTH